MQRLEEEGEEMIKLKQDDKCPTCGQDMSIPPREGNSGKDCPQCGQGLSKTLAKRVKKRKAKEK